MRKCQLLPLDTYRRQKRCHINDLLDVLNNPANLIRWEYKRFSLICLTLLWLSNMVMVTESAINWSSLMSSTIMQSLTFLTFIVSEKIAALKFLSCNTVTWPAQNWSWQIVRLTFSCESKTGLETYISLPRKCICQCHIFDIPVF